MRRDTNIPSAYQPSHQEKCWGFAHTFYRLSLKDWAKAIRCELFQISALFGHLSFPVSFLYLSVNFSWNHVIINHTQVWRKPHPSWFMEGSQILCLWSWYNYYTSIFSYFTLKTAPVCMINFTWSPFYNVKLSQPQPHSTQKSIGKSVRYSRTESMR